MWKPIFKLLSQLYTDVFVDVLPVYYPNENEKNDPDLYARNVQKVIASHTNTPINNTFDYKSAPVFKFDKKFK